MNIFSFTFLNNWNYAAKFYKKVWGEHYHGTWMPLPPSADQPKSTLSLIPSPCSYHPPSLLFHVTFYFLYYFKIKPSVQFALPSWEPGCICVGSGRPGGWVRAPWQGSKTTSCSWPLKVQHPEQTRLVQLWSTAFVRQCFRSWWNIQ